MEKRRRVESNQKRETIQQKIQALKEHKLEGEIDNWEMVKKHPIAKVVLVVGVTFGLLYLSSYLLDAAAKTAKSFQDFREAVKLA